MSQDVIGINLAIRVLHTPDSIMPDHRSLIPEFVSLSMSVCNLISLYIVSFERVKD